MKKLFSIFDSKAEFYCPPVTHRNSAEAIRTFETTVKQEGSNIHSYPSDYTLVEIGVYDEDSGRIEPYEAPKILANGADYQDN